MNAALYSFVFELHLRRKVSQRNIAVHHFNSYLMSVGLEPVFSGDEVFFRQFPVHRACRDGDVSALVSLLQQLSNQGQLTTEDSCYGWTPLHWAAHYGQVGSCYLQE